MRVDRIEKQLNKPWYKATLLGKQYRITYFDYEYNVIGLEVGGWNVFYPINDQFTIDAVVMSSIMLHQDRLNKFIYNMKKPSYLKNWRELLAEMRDANPQEAQHIADTLIKVYMPEWYEEACKIIKNATPR